MTTTKRRLSASVDAELLRGAKRSARLAACTLSAWVNDALKRHLDEEGRLGRLDAAVVAHEAEFGPISEEAMARADRELETRTIRVRRGSVAAAQRVRNAR